MNEFETALRAAAEQIELPLDDRQIADCTTYYEMLVDWNTRMNLTAITDPEGAAVKHFADSLLLLRAVELPEGGRLADIGTGAGFPAVPVGIVRRDLKLTLIDSLQKRIGFLKELTGTLKLSADCLHGRAEELGKGVLRETQDVVTARAVAPLRTLAEYCLPFVKVDGVFVALKGPEIEDERREAEKAIALLGGETERVEKYMLPDGSRRELVVIKKISQTPPKYPRNAAKMAKTPL